MPVSHAAGKGESRTAIARRRGLLSAARGVTLIEVMIVVAIIGIVAAIATPNLQPVLQNQKLVAAGEEVAALVERARRKAYNEGRCYRVRVSGDNLVLQRKGGNNGANCKGDAGGFDISSHTWEAAIATVRPETGAISFGIDTNYGQDEIIFRPSSRLRGDGDHVSDDRAQVTAEHALLGKGIAFRVTPVGRICRVPFDGSAPSVAAAVAECP